jgi:hypothetical protein
MSGAIFDRFGKPGAITGFVVVEPPPRLGAFYASLAGSARRVAKHADLAKAASAIRSAALDLQKNFARQNVESEPIDTVIIPQEVAVEPADIVLPDRMSQHREAPARRTLFLSISATGLAIAACLALLPATSSPPDPEPAAIVASVPEAPRWREIVKPFQIFVLESRALNPLSFEYRARSRSDGPLEDMLIYRDAGEHGGLPAAMMVVGRNAKPQTEGETLYTQSVARAGDFGASVLRASMPAPLETKFGAFEVADLRVSTGRGEISCLAFRHSAAEAPVTLSGWKCGKNAHENDRQGLRCFIDRLDIMSAGQSVWLRNYFAQSEADRKFCATAAASANPDLIGAATPSLKRDITGTVAPKPKAKAKPKKQSRTAKKAAKPKAD